MDPTYLRSLAISANGFVFDPRTGHSYTANATAMMIVTKLQQGQTPSQIVDALRKEWGAPDSVDEDVRRFVETLRELGLGGRRSPGGEA